mmetsp:Transcript_23945/g.68550  ORF Transcript_23945/g.68550 Transcript_23945/m.68550 type:complete len:260 (-) Transcript_23945:189-968(-)
MVNPPSPAEWLPPDGAEVRIEGLVGDNAAFNGCCGRVLRCSENSQRLIVCVDQSGARLRVHPRNVCQPRTQPTGVSQLNGMGATLPCLAAPRCVVHLQPSKRKPLGFGAGVDRRSLRLTRIDPEGLLREWNAKHPGSAVQLGDRIVEVNGRCGSIQSLVDELRSQTNLSIVFQRGSETPSPFLPKVMERVEAAPPEPHRGGPRARAEGCRGSGGGSTPSECSLEIDGQRGANLLHNLKRMVAQLERTCGDEDFWGQKSR